jgi:hypothetical protein
MEPATMTAVAALATSAAAFATVAFNTWSSRKNVERTNENARAIEQLRIDNEAAKAAAQKQAAVSKFSEPLARSAYDLQSRLYNILKLGLVDRFLVKGSARDKQYVIDNTAFLIAQYQCWTELARREIQFIDLGKNEETRKLSTLQDQILSAWGTDSLPPAFRLFAGEQRVIGEALIVKDEHGSECVGYGVFLKVFPPGADALIDALRTDVSSLDGGLQQAIQRLRTLQHHLIDLLKILDPDAIRFPNTAREKA